MTGHDFVDVVLGFMSATALVASLRHRVVIDELEKRMAECRGHWQRDVKRGGPWHLVERRPFGEFSALAKCGFAFTNGWQETERDPDPRARCEACQRIYIMEKTR